MISSEDTRKTETKDVIVKLRNEKGWTQEELAERTLVTRQAVSRWENGETIPNTDTLKLLSKEFDVSVNTFLGSPRTLICQCCGMPLEDETVSRESSGEFNEDYCKWCYHDGIFAYTDMKTLIDFCVSNYATKEWPERQMREHLESFLPTLKYWKR